MTAGDASPAPALSVEGVGFTWPGPRRFSLEMSGFTVAPRERVLLVGPSGAGKSTLLSLICGVVAPDRGAITIGGAPFSALSAAKRDRFRAERLGVVFQMFNLLPYATPLDNVLLQLTFAPERRKRLRDPRAEARRLLTALGLPEAVIDRASASSLSVGQQQRVAVARALIGGPSLVVADEPTSALDADAQDAFLELLSDQLAKTGASLLMVSHDQRLAPRFDRTIALSDIAQTERRAA